MYKTENYKAAEAGINGNGVIPHILPVPKAHIAFVHHAGQWHTLMISSGQVIEICAASDRKDYIHGFASGYAQAMNMPCYAASVGGSDTAAEAYADLWTTQAGPLIQAELIGQLERIEHIWAPTRLC